MAYLSKYCINLTEKAYHMEPITGRDKVIDEIIVESTTMKDAKDEARDMAYEKGYAFCDFISCRKVEVE